jgi:hypothetical protein
MTQNAVSRLESPNYGKPTITTLKRLAAALDVGLIVRFVPFSELIDWVSSTPRIDEGLNDKALSVASFDLEEQQGALDLPTIGDSNRTLQEPSSKLPIAPGLMGVIYLRDLGIDFMAGLKEASAWPVGEIEHKLSIALKRPLEVGIKTDPAKTATDIGVMSEPALRWGLRGLITDAGQSVKQMNLS